MLFDLGGVVINIDWKRSVYEFAALLDSDFESLNQIMRKEELVQKIETGIFDEDTFRNWFREYFQKDFNDQDIDAAWNAMLLDIPKERIELLKNLRSQFNTMCLSNTNSIHIRRFNELLGEKSDYTDLKDLLDKTYYSHLIKARKPDKSTWQIILDENNLEPSSVLYFDDNETNHQVALDMGINSIHIDNNYRIEDFFNE